MKTYRTDAFFERFPFLVNGDNPLVQNPDQVEAVKVEKFTPEFLEQIPQYDGVTGSIVDIEDSQNIYLLDEGGNILVKVEQGGGCTHNEAYTDDEHYNGETVGNALLRTDPDDVRYAVLIHTGYEIRDHFSVGGYSVTVYPIPEDFSLPSWIRKQRALAENEIRQEVELATAI